MQETQLFDGMVIFTKIVELQSFSAAAEATGHSTSHISKTFNKLEQRIGTRLLNRTTRSQSLTPEGEVFYRQCQQMVNDAKTALGMLDNKLQQPSGKLKISCPVSLGLRYLQPVLSKYLNLYPDVTLDLDLSDRHVDVIQDGFDLVIRATAQLDDSTLVCKRLRSFKGYTVATPEYLKQYGTPTEPAQLVDHKCICYSNLKQPTRWQFSHANKQDTFVDVGQYVGCNSSAMEVAMVLDHHGICRLPEFTLGNLLDIGQLVTLFDDYHHTHIDVFAIYPSKTYLSAKVRAMVDLLVTDMAKEQP
ncbi:LysR family transcriptional regulator [Shewanella maritima]|nr:LysR family transcriptional regulator [Shewanella maritima]